MPQKRSRKMPFLAGFLCAAFLGYIGWSYLAIPARTYAATVTYENNEIPAEPISLDWPTQGQAAIATTDQGILATFGKQQSAPTASMAKVMTALAILKEKPLGVGEQGPEIIFTQADVDIYNKYVAQNGSVALVRAGEKITQYQALQALLLPSANNMADTLAIWAFGSLENYVTYVNDYAGKLGMNTSHFADASGFNPATQSTPIDLIKLGKEALKNKVLAEIVSQESATIPVAGTIRNSNRLLDDGDGFIGLKTGTTDQAGGCLLWAATYNVGTTPVTIIGVVMGTADRNAAMIEASQLLLSAKNNFAERTIVKKGVTVGNYTLPWGERIEAITADDIKTVTWKGVKTETRVSLDTTSGTIAQGDTVGKLLGTSTTVGSGEIVHSVPVIAKDSASPPNLWWRVTHPLETWQIRFGKYT